jgi:YD repeat-containing protein
MFHGTDMPFDYIMTKYIPTENGELRQSMYKYTYKENIDYEKLHNDVEEIVMGGKKTDTQQSTRYKPIEHFNPDSVSVSVETVEPREKTEYVAEKPYKEYDIGYDVIVSSYKYNELNISLNESVKSVVQTVVPTSVLKYEKSSESVYAQQQTWLFSKFGNLIYCDIYKILLKNIHEYDINSSKILSEDEYDFIALLTSYFFDATGRLNQVVEDADGHDVGFEYDQNGHLTKISTYYREYDRLSEEVITLNEKGKPVRVEKFVYKDELKSRKCPSDLGPSGVKSVGVIDTYCYDDRGNRVAHQMNNGKRAHWMDAFVYDNLNNMIFEGRCDGYDGNNRTCKCKGFRKNKGYEYDDQHNMIREYSIGDWKPSGWDYYYQYDSAGREIEYKHYDLLGSKRTFDRHIQTTYDSDGRMVKKKALLGDFRINEAVFDYIMADLEEWMYDEHGNLVEHVAYQSNDSRPYKIVRWQYAYDQQGNWVKRIRYEGRSKDSMTVTEILERQIQYY